MGGTVCPQKVKEYKKILHRPWLKTFPKTLKLMEQGKWTNIWKKKNEKARNTLAKSLEHRRYITKTCPKCNIVVENLCKKCDRMTCLKCNFTFCWICGIDVGDHAGERDDIHDLWKEKDPLLAGKSC